MVVELNVPEAGESITEVEIGEWLKVEGDRVRREEPVVVLESDKAALELASPVTGVLTKILHPTGDVVAPGAVIAHLTEEAEVEPVGKRTEQTGGDDGAKKPSRTPETNGAAASPPVTPAARRELAARGLTAESVTGSGSGGRILKEDVLRHEAEEPSAAPEGQPRDTPAAETPAAPPERQEESVRMSLLRRTVARRLVEAQQTAALLTTFNEIDLSAVIALRREQGEGFRQVHGVKLGFMSFFVKACIEALKRVPEVNAEVRGENLVYRNYYDIGIAVGSGRGLVVPVLRDAHRMSFADIERAIADFAARAAQNRLAVQELQGGTFTISNGGIFGSLLSTPLVNPPQSGVLGMHAIQDRPVAREGRVVIRPMMYVALTYDHRVVDGRGAVTFLRTVKECVETPARLLLEV